jgi:hypothetical protein
LSWKRGKGEKGKRERRKGRGKGGRVKGSAEKGIINIGEFPTQQVAKFCTINPCNKKC